MGSLGPPRSLQDVQEQRVYSPEGLAGARPSGNSSAQPTLGFPTTANSQSSPRNSSDGFNNTLPRGFAPPKWQPERQAATPPLLVLHFPPELPHFIALPSNLEEAVAEAREHFEISDDLKVMLSITLGLTHGAPEKRTGALTKSSWNVLLGPNWYGKPGVISDITVVATPRKIVLGKRKAEEEIKEEVRQTPEREGSKAVASGSGEKKVRIQQEVPQIGHAPASSSPPTAARASHTPLAEVSNSSSRSPSTSENTMRYNITLSDRHRTNLSLSVKPSTLIQNLREAYQKAKPEYARSYIQLTSMPSGLRIPASVVTVGECAKKFGMEKKEGWTIEVEALK